MSPKIRIMQNIIESIIDFFAGEIRTFLAIGIFIGILYVWDKLSEKEQYYRWLVKINPKNAQAHYNLGIFLRELPDRKTEAEYEFRQAIALRAQYSWAYYALYYLQIE